MGTKTKLSAAVLALVLGGATADKILDQFLDEKEGVRTIAYQDGGQRIWTICRGLTRIEGKPVTRGMKLSYSECKRYDAIERDKAIAWVDEKYTKELNDAKSEIDILRADVAAGRRRLQLHARCMSTADHKTAATSVDNAATARLEDSAERDYFTLTERLTTMEKQLRGGQQWIVEQCR